MWSPFWTAPDASAFPNIKILHSYNSLNGPSPDSFQYVHFSLILGNPELDRVFQVWSHQCHVEGRDHLPQSAGNTPYMRPRKFPSSIYWCMGLFLPRVRTLHFPLLNFMRVMQAHFFSLLRPFWIAVQPSSLFVGPLSFIIYSFAERTLFPTMLRYWIVLVPGLNPGIHRSRLTSSWTWYYWSRSFDRCIFWLLKGIKGFPKRVCSLLSCERSQADTPDISTSDKSFWMDCLDIHLHMPVRTLYEIWNETHEKMSMNDRNQC